jgi:hypothetical protein
METTGTVENVLMMACMEHIRIKECRTINKEEAGVVGVVVLETLVSSKEEEATSMEVDDILVEALVRETSVKTEVEEASMEEGVGTGAVEVDSKL